MSQGNRSNVALEIWLKDMKDNLLNFVRGQTWHKEEEKLNGMV